MKTPSLCIFAGTTEGRALAELLESQPVRVTACVATEYGEALLGPAERRTVRAGRLDEAGMEELFTRASFDLVIDATHPYASLVTEQLARACRTAGVEYLRLVRGASALPPEAVCLPDASAAAEFLAGTKGNILLTTGSKDLACFSRMPGFGQRVYARVLPLAASLAACEEVGLAPAHRIAMQGPFSEEMNLATLHAVEARYLVTKDGGAPGGFAAKAAAAQKAGAKLVVIGRPPQPEGLSFQETAAYLNQKFGLGLSVPCQKEELL